MFTSLLTKNRGFQVIELLIAIVVISFLVGLLINNSRNNTIKEQDLERQEDVLVLYTQLEDYRRETGHYPSGSDEDTNCGDGTESCTLSVDLLGNNVSEALTDPNGNPVQIVSEEPTLDNGAYYYFPSGCDGGQCQSYSLYADLIKNPNDYQRQSIR